MPGAAGMSPAKLAQQCSSSWSSRGWPGTFTDTARCVKPAQGSAGSPAPISTPTPALCVSSHSAARCLSSPTSCSTRMITGTDASGNIMASSVAAARRGQQRQGFGRRDLRTVVVSRATDSPSALAARSRRSRATRWNSCTRSGTGSAPGMVAGAAGLAACAAGASDVSPSVAAAAVRVAALARAASAAATA